MRKKTNTSSPTILNRKTTLRRGLIMSVIALSLNLLISMPSRAQNIDIGDPAQVFTVSGSSENFNSEEAALAMFAAAGSQCSGLGSPRQLSPTRYRTAYGARRATAEFDCQGSTTDTDSEYVTPPVDPGPHRRCWYPDDSNPYCFHHSADAVFENTARPMGLCWNWNASTKRCDD